MVLEVSIDDEEEEGSLHAARGADGFLEMECWMVFWVSLGYLTGV